MFTATGEIIVSLTGPGLNALWFRAYIQGGAVNSTSATVAGRTAKMEKRNDEIIGKMQRDANILK
jgi:hypothetical protein